jgi:hypothetical protein
MVATTMPTPLFDATRCCSAAFNAEPLAQLWAESCAAQRSRTEMDRAASRGKSFLEIMAGNDN